MGNIQYIGARYVIKLYENSQNPNSAEWEATTYYERLVMVTYNNSSYLSKKDVPATVGNPADNPDYWLITGYYNGQMQVLQHQIDVINEKDNSIFYTPQMFGAKGDGVTDDTQALQNCIDNAFADKVKIIIPAGEYCFTSLTIKTATQSAEEFVPEICGIDRNTSILKHTGAGVALDVVYDSNGTHGDGFKIHDLFIQGNSNTTVLLELCKGTNFTICDIRLTTASIAGIRNTNKMWLSSFERIRISHCATGIKISGSSVTSIYYNEIYVLYSTVYAYDLVGSYCNIGVLAADYCTGEYVYNFYYFNGNIGSLACELCEVTKGIIKFDTTCALINEVLALRTDFGSEADSPFYLSSSQIDIHDLFLIAAETTVSDIPIVSMYASAFSVFAYERSNITFAAAKDRGSNTSIFTYKNNSKLAYSNRAYVGFNKSLSTTIQKVDFPSGVTIYTDCAGAPKYNSEGANLEYSSPTKLGDWYIENKPDVNYAAAYVMLGDATGYITPVPYCFIPIVKSGVSTDRPTNAPRGSYFFDTTLNKPIWYNGTNWVDSTGTTV